MRDEELNDQRNFNNIFGIVNISGPPKLKLWITKHKIGSSYEFATRNSEEPNLIMAQDI